MFAVVLVVALCGVVQPAGKAVAQPGAAARAGACSWQLDTWLPLPPGYPGGVVSAVDVGDRVVGTVINTTVFDDFRAVVWRARRAILLPTPAGSSSFTFGANRHGDVVGIVFEAGNGFRGPNRPVLWRGGGMIELAVPPGAEASAMDINDAGLIVGHSLDLAGEQRALVWSADAPAEVREVTAPVRINSIAVVTEKGILAGSGITTDEPVRNVALAGTVAAGLHVLPDLHPGDFTIAFAAGGAYLAGVALPATGGSASAVLWHDEVPQALSTRPAEALAVNSQGVATGNRLDDFQPVVWSSGQEQELPIVRFGQPLFSGIGQAITEDGRTVGGIVHPTASPPDSQPVLWHCR